MNFGIAMTSPIHLPTPLGEKRWKNPCDIPTHDRVNEHNLASKISFPTVEPSTEDVVRECFEGGDIVDEILNRYVSIS